MSGGDLIVRGYRPEDRPAVRRICHVTGYMGDPADWYWADEDSFADTWTGYYTDKEPESCGVVELDEDPRDAVRREVLEETGVHIEPGPLTGVYKNMKRGIVSLVFRCRPIAGEPHPTEEATEVTWFDRDRVNRDMAEAFAIRLLDALDASGPHVRVHDGEHLLG